MVEHTPDWDTVGPELLAALEEIINTTSIVDIPAMARLIAREAIAKARGIYPPKWRERRRNNTTEVVSALLEALIDLTALYAATVGHDPSFVKKAQSAIAKARGTG